MSTALSPRAPPPYHLGAVVHFYTIRAAPHQYQHLHGRQDEDDLFSLPDIIVQPETSGWGAAARTTSSPIRDSQDSVLANQKGRWLVTKLAISIKYKILCLENKTKHFNVRIMPLLNLGTRTTILIS